MIKQIIRLCFLIIPFSINAQDSFTIHGQINRVTKSDSIILGSSWGTFVARIQEDGRFVLTGVGIKEPGDALIYTNTSNANSIWLEPGEYTMECKEVWLAATTRPVFRISLLKGPKDAEINHGFHEKFFEFNDVPREQRQQVAQRFFINYIDSIFQNFPSSSVLPKLVRSSMPVIGDEAAKNYYSLLSNDLIAKPGGGAQLADYFKRKEKIEKEKYFQDFVMKDQYGKTFSLSSLDKKLILLDFWSSDCAPCRKKHINLAKLYTKYSNLGFEIISISLDDTETEWKKAIIKDNMNWINVSDLHGWETGIAKDYFVSSLPFSFLLDKDRKIIAADRDVTSEEIEKYLK